MRNTAIALIALFVVAGGCSSCSSNAPKAPETASKIEVPHVSDATFDEEVLKAELPVLVDFWAPWCGPCRVVGPIVGALSEEYKGKLKVVKLNTDENPKSSQLYKITGIPSLLIFKGGEKVDQVVGALPKDKLRAFIDKNL